MDKKLYENEIIDNWVDENEPKELTEKRYSELNKIVDPMYDFILAYSNYYSQRRDYGTGYKLTMIEAHILTEINDNKGITVTELAQKWHRTNSAISQIVRRLMKWDFIIRENNKENGKIFHLFTTDKGKETVLAHKNYDNIDIVKTRRKLLKSFTVDELVAFDKICKAYTDILREQNY